MINRNAVITHPKQPYINWVSQLDNSSITPAQNDEPTIYLISSEYNDNSSAWVYLEQINDGLSRLQLRRFREMFFQTTCFGTNSARPKYSGTWQRACLEHRGKIACAQGLTEFAAEKAAGIDRSFKAIDCTLDPEAGEIQFILESEAEAIRSMPTNREHWERRGRMII